MIQMILDGIIAVLSFSTIFVQVSLHIIDTVALLTWNLISSQFKFTTAYNTPYILDIQYAYCILDVPLNHSTFIFYQMCMFR